MYYLSQYFADSFKDMSKKMLVSLDQNHKYVSFLLIIHAQHSQKIWKDPNILLQQILFCSMIVPTLQLISLKRDLSYKFENKQI